MCSLSGVGKAQHCAELQTQEQVEEDEGLLGQSARDVVFLQESRQIRAESLTNNLIHLSLS